MANDCSRPFIVVGRLNELGAWPDQENESSAKAPRFDGEMPRIQSSCLDSRAQNYRTKERCISDRWLRPIGNRNAFSYKAIFDGRLQKFTNPSSSPSAWRSMVDPYDVLKISIAARLSRDIRAAGLKDLRQPNARPVDSTGGLRKREVPTPYALTKP